MRERLFIKHFANEMKSNKNDEEDDYDDDQKNKVTSFFSYRQKKKIGQRNKL